MSNSITTVIAKVNKLRELSKNNPNQHEAQAAAAAADRLISQHQLSEMDLQIKDSRAAESIEIISEALFTSGRVMLWKSQLAVILCNHYGCEVFVSTVSSDSGRRGTEKAYKVVGRRSDFDIVKYMFTWLSELITECCKNEASGMGHAFSQNYAIGIVQGIKNQLKAQHDNLKKEAKHQGMSAAMVLLDNRLTAAKDYLNQELGGKLKKSQPSKQSLHAGAYQAGVQKGESIPLTKGIETSSERKMLKMLK